MIRQPILSFAKIQEMSPFVTWRAIRNNATPRIAKVSIRIKVKLELES